MKIITILFFFVFTYSRAFSQNAAQIDSINIYKINNIYNYKTCYIGEPFSILLNDLNLVVRFGPPDNIGSRALGTAYYQNFIVFLPWVAGIPQIGFKITLANKVSGDVGEYFRKISNGLWDIQMRLVLGKEIVTDIKKLQ